MTSILTSQEITSRKITLTISSAQVVGIRAVISVLLYETFGMELNLMVIGKYGYAGLAFLSS